MISKPQQALLAALQNACQSKQWSQLDRLLDEFQKPPNHALLCFARGYALMQQGQWQAAQAELKLAIQQGVFPLEARRNLVLALVKSCQNTEAQAVLEQILQQAPWDLNGLQQLINIQLITGQHQALQITVSSILQAGFESGLKQHARQMHPRWLDWQPQLAAILLLDQFASCADAVLLRLSIQNWWQSYLKHRYPLSPIYAHLHSERADAPLRIGYVSREWSQAPIDLGFANLFAYHDLEQFQIFAYSDAGAVNYPQFHKVSDSSGWNDYQFYQAVQADQIDILVDLSGFFNPKRLLSLALKPAPIQILAGSNPPFAAFADCFDAVLSHDVLIPVERQGDMPEQLLDQGCFFYWKAPRVSPDVTSLPLLQGGVPSLGILASPNKINADTIQLWAEVLKALPDSRLCFKNQLYADSLLQARYRQDFARHGITGERLHFEDHQTSSDLFTFLQDIDLVLDSFPYTGALSTCDAWWMGVPVISLSGGHLIADSIAATLNDHAFLAKDPEHYVKLVKALCDQPESLQIRRQQMRQQLARSQYCNGSQQARCNEIFYRSLWREKLLQSDV